MNAVTAAVGSTDSNNNYASNNSNRTSGAAAANNSGSNPPAHLLVNKKKSVSTAVTAADKRHIQQVVSKLKIQQTKERMQMVLDGTKQTGSTMPRKQESSDHTANSVLNKSNVQG